MEKQHAIKIPESYLLTIAVHGNMGDGELPDIMRAWAQKECARLGLAEKLKQLQVERLRELEIRLRHTLGDQAVDHIGAAIAEAARKLSA